MCDSVSHGERERERETRSPCRWGRAASLSIALLHGSCRRVWESRHNDFRHASLSHWLAAMSESYVDISSLDGLCVHVDIGNWSHFHARSRLIFLQIVEF